LDRVASTPLSLLLIFFATILLLFVLSISGGAEQRITARQRAAWQRERDVKDEASRIKNAEIAERNRRKRSNREARYAREQARGSE